MSIGGIIHVYNEEMLLPHWLEHHKNVFSEGIIIDHLSTDKTVEIANDFISKNPTWRLVKTEMLEFYAMANDEEVMKYERQLTTKWKMALNVTEFMFTPNLAAKLDVWEQAEPGAMAFGARSACLVDKEILPLTSPLFKDRTHGILDYEARNPIASLRRWRYIHKAEHGHYQTGRHGTFLPLFNKSEFLILHFLYSPWDHCKARKLQIQNKIPQTDKAAGLGAEHIVTDEQLETNRKNLLAISYDLREIEIFNDYYTQMAN